MLTGTFQSSDLTSSYPLWPGCLKLTNEYPLALEKLRFIVICISPFCETVRLRYSADALAPGETIAFDVTVLLDYDFVHLDCYYFIQGEAKKSFLSFDAHVSRRSSGSDHPGDIVKSEMRSNDSSYLLPDIEEVVDGISGIRKLRHNTVLILGCDTGAHLDELKKIQWLLSRTGKRGLLLKEFDDRLDEFVEEKLVRFATSVDLVIVEHSTAAGQIDELVFLRFLRKTTAILQKDGQGVTWMQSDYHIDNNFMKYFPYSELTDDLVSEVLSWAAQNNEKKADALNRLYPWRSPKSGSQK